MKYIGIDPGLSGAAALIEVEVGVIPKVLEVVYFERVRLCDTQDIIDTAPILDLAQRADRAVIELVGSRPDQSAPSTFKFGTTFGQCLAVLQAAKKPIRAVRPSDWKAQMGVTSDKSLTKRFAEAILRFRFRRNDGAEAALIALWGALADGYKHSNKV